jgi:tripartite-type tricarboxylate transporter receptor subunit TctC
MRMSRTLLAAALFIAAFLSGAAFAEAPYPNKPIRLVVPYPPGGSSDTLARILADKLTQRWQQTVLVDNRPGAAGALAANLVAKAPADGYTLLFGTTANFAVTPLLERVSYDPLRDFTTIAMMAESWELLVIDPSLPAKTVPDFVALARQKPRELNFGSPGQGSLFHLRGEMFAKATGIELMHVPYRGSGPAQADLLGGRIQMLFDSAVLSYVRRGQMRAIGIFEDRRWGTVPDVPTISEQGVAMKGSPGWWGVLAPAGLPSAIAERIKDTVKEVLTLPDVAGKLDAAGTRPAYLGPKDFDARYRRDIEDYRQVIQDSKIALQ